jgi:hypothetical protein
MVETTRLLMIAEQISLLPEGASFNEPDFEVTDVAIILNRMKVTGTEFHLLDDTPGRLGYDLGNGRGWHWKLRRFRNTILRDHKLEPEVRCKQCGAYRHRGGSGRLAPCTVEHRRTS